MTDKTITFLANSYSATDLKDLSDEKLLELRNLVATNLGVASIRAFKDHDAAVEQTWKALERFESTTNEEAGGIEKVAKVKVTKAPKAPKEPKDRKPAKSSMPQLVKRPTAKMFSTIKKVGEHNGTDHGRAHRWPNYTDGMTLVDVIEGDGTEPWDVYNWQGKGIMSITEPTEAEHLERRAAWYKKHNLIDPDLSKETKVAARAEAKLARDAEVAAKKTAKEAEKAVKAAAASAAASAEAA